MACSGHVCGSFLRHRSLALGIVLFAVSCEAFVIPGAGPSALTGNVRSPMTVSSPLGLRRASSSAAPRYLGRPQCALRVFAQLGSEGRPGESVRKSRTASLRMCESSTAGDLATVPKSQEKFEDALRNGKMKEVLEMLRKDDVEVSFEQAGQVLGMIPLEMNEETEQECQIMTSLAYSGLKKKGLLSSFGSVQANPLSLPLATKDIDVIELEKRINMPMKALTPRGSQFGWQTAGILLCAVEYVVAQKLGLDPVRTVIPDTAFAFLVDRIAFSGAVFESFYRLLFPTYKEKVIKHEAGHFLLAYLMGCPIQGFFLSAWDAAKAGIRGQAGTVFFDNDLSNQLNENKVTRTAIDRYTIVLMGGIAAEAMSYEQAEGGASDESALVNFLLGLTPPWDQPRVLNQARWAVTQAVLLLNEHREAYDVLADAMAKNKPLGECVAALETELQKMDTLPAVARAEQRGNEMDQKGLQTVTEPSPSSNLLSELDSQIADKEEMLKKIQDEEKEIRDQLRELDGKEAQSSSGEKKSSSSWDKDETQRFMDVLVKARRKEKAAQAGKGGNKVEIMLAEASRNRELAEVDLEMRKKQIELAEIESKIKKLQDGQ